MKRITLKLVTIGLVAGMNSVCAAELEKPVINAIESDSSKQTIQKPLYNTMATDLMDTLDLNVDTHLASRLVTIEEALLETLTHSFSR
jgi:hypothetical protein